MGKKKPTTTFKKFNEENLESINAKKLQIEKQGSSNPKNSALNSERKPKEAQTKKGRESISSSSSSTTTIEERKKTEEKLPETTHEVKNQVELPNQETSLSGGQAHHNVDKEDAIQQVLVENDDKAINTHNTKVLDINLTTSTKNSPETFTNISDKKETVTLRDTRTEVKSPITDSTNMERPAKDVQAFKPKPDNPAWINNTTGSIPFPGHPFSGLNPNASEFTPGGSFATTNTPTLPDVHPTLQREIVRLDDHPAVPPGMLVQPNRMSTRPTIHTNAQFPVQPFPRTLQKNTPSSLQEEPSYLPGESTFFVEGPMANFNAPVPELNNSTNVWKVEQIRTDNNQAAQGTERPLHSSQGVSSIPYAQQSMQDSAQVPQPSSHRTLIEPIHEVPKVEPTSSSNNWSEEEYREPNHNKPDQRQDWDNNSRFQGNQRDSFNRNSDRSRGFQDSRDGRGGGRRFHEDKEETRGGRGKDRLFNEDRGFGRRNDRFRTSEPEKGNEGRDQNLKDRMNKDDRRGGRGRRYNDGKEFDGRRDGKFRSSETEKGNQSHSYEDWDDEKKERRRNSKEIQEKTGKEHDRVEKKDDFYRDRERSERNPPDFESTRGRGRRQNDNWKGNNTRQNRGDENRGYGPRGDSRPFQRDQYRDSVEKKFHSSDRDEDKRQNFESTAEIPGAKENKLLERTSKSETPWRDRTSEDSNRYFTTNRDEKYRGRDTNNSRYSDNRGRGGAYGNSRGRGDVQFPRGSNSNFGREMKGGRGKDSGRGRHNSTRTTHDEGEVRRNSMEAMEITNDDSSKDSTDFYHITDEDSNDVPEKIVELGVSSARSPIGTSEMSRNSESWDDWNDSVDNAVEAGLELSKWNTLPTSEVEVKPITQSSVENISQEEEEPYNMPKRRGNNSVSEREKRVQGPSRNSSHRTSERRDGEQQHRSKKPIDPRMERTKQNRSADSAYSGSDWSTASSATMTSESRLKQTRITSYTIDQDSEKEHSDKEFDRWEDAWHKIKDFHVVQEVQGNLFEQPKDFSLAHCVAEDLRMGSGIAVDFKREFKNVDDLLDQRAKQGGLATLHDKATNRFVYYLVTKRESTGKPTYLTLWRSLNKMKDHIKENEVKKLAIPRIACGLDRLEWNRVKSMIEHLFNELDVEIRVCNFQQDEEVTKKSWFTCKIVFQDTPITQIETETLIFYFTTANGDVDETMIELSKKFNFLNTFKNHKSKNLGEIVYSEDKGYGLCGCIVRNSRRDMISFKSLFRCIREFNKKNKTFGTNAFSYVAHQEVKTADYFDDLINQKIVTLFINFLRNVDVYVCTGSFNGSGE